MKSIFKLLFGFALAVGIGFSVLENTSVVEANAEETNVSTKITEINNENLDHGNSFVMVLSANDYMTATEWSGADYKWINAEDYTEAQRDSIDFANNNVCNVPLDCNLTAYNFEEYIFIDGVALSTFGQTNAYKLIANKRQRINTLSIDFGPDVLQNVQTIEIREGCELPTLAYSYRGVGEKTALVVEKTVSFHRLDGQWTDFVDYAEGVEYAGDEEMFSLNLEETYKGHTAVPLNGYTEVFINNAVQGEYLDHKIFVSGSNTAQGNLMVLHFVHPIDATKFNQLNLRVYINHQVDVLTYNANDITTESLGTALESFTVGGGQFVRLTLNSLLYAGEDNRVSTIVFQFAGDCDPQLKDGQLIYDGNGNIIRDTFHFVSFNVSNIESDGLVSDDSFMVLDTPDAYEITFRFNKVGTFTETALDLEKVKLNGYMLAQIKAECNDMQAEWYSARGIFQINVILPKAYTGAAQIKNGAYSYAGNNMSVMKGLVFPNGETLGKTYTCHLYAGEKFADCELVSEFDTIELLDIKVSFDAKSNNIRFTLYFDKNVTSAPYYHACEIEKWRQTDLVESHESLYDKGTSEIFLVGGYKSSLMDNIFVNGYTIGEWHAHDSRMVTNVQVHYGNSGLNCIDVIFAEACPDTYSKVYNSVTSGNGITIDVKEGLKLMTNVATTEDKKFVLANGVFSEAIAVQPLHVYFNGSEVTNGSSITVDAAAIDGSIAVEGVSDYTITSTQTDNVTKYTIAYGNSEQFVFTVTLNKVEMTETPKTDSTTGEEGGCSSQMGLSAVTGLGTILAVATAIMLGRKRKYEEKYDN